MYARMIKTSYGIPEGTVFKVWKIGFRKKRNRTILLTDFRDARAAYRIGDMVLQYEDPHGPEPKHNGQHYEATWVALGIDAELIDYNNEDMVASVLKNKEGF